MRFHAGSRRKASIAAIAPIAIALVVGTAGAVSTQSAAAGPNPNLCAYNDSRGPVSRDFILDACVDGSSIVVKDDESFPVLIHRSPADSRSGTELQGVGTPQPVSLSQTSYAVITRGEYASSGNSDALLLPGDVVRFPIGPDGGQIELSQVSERLLVTYAAGQIVSDLSPRLSVPDALRAWTTALLQGKQEYDNCIARSQTTAVQCIKLATAVIVSNAARLLANLGSAYLKGIPQAILHVGSFLTTMTSQYFAFSDGVGYLSQAPLAPPPSFGLPDAVAYVAYSGTLPGLAGGTPPYVWQVTSGSLPDGLSLETSTGVISGTPLNADCFRTDIAPVCLTVTSAFTVQVTDSQGQTTTTSERIRVLPVLMCTANCPVQVVLTTTLVSPLSLVVTSPAQPPCGAVPVQCESAAFVRHVDGSITGHWQYGWVGTIGWISPAAFLFSNGINGCSEGELAWLNVGTWDGIPGHPLHLVASSNAVQCQAPTPPYLLRPNLIAPPDEAIIPQNNAASGCPASPTSGYGYMINFAWALDPNGIAPARYEIVVQRAGSSLPLLSTTVDATHFLLVQCGAFVADTNLSGWQWWVRSLDAAGNASLWATRNFSFAPCRLADNTQCHG
jgi:hypothetical protein